VLNGANSDQLDKAINQMMMAMTHSCLISSLKINDKNLRFRNIIHKFISMSWQKPSKLVADPQPEKKEYRCPFWRRGDRCYGWCGVMAMAMAMAMAKSSIRPWLGLISPQTDSI
jgi:hypothetical protein